MITVILNIYESKFGANPFRQDIKCPDNTDVVDFIEYINAYNPKWQAHKIIVEQEKMGYLQPHWCKSCSEYNKCSNFGKEGANFKYDCWKDSPTRESVKLSDFDKLIGMFRFAWSEDKTYNRGWNDCRGEIIADIKRFLGMDNDPCEPMIEFEPEKTEDNQWQDKPNSIGWHWLHQDGVSSVVYVYPIDDIYPDLQVRFDSGNRHNVKEIYGKWKKINHEVPEKPIPKCSLCNKQSTGAIFVIGDGESAYTCKEHEGLLARL
jgi:hypothetical protein